MKKLGRTGKIKTAEMVYLTAFLLIVLSTLINVIVNLIIKNGENGILTSSDIHEFSKAIQKLMINTELRRKLALNGMYSCSQYSVEKVVDRWINLFESLYGNEK